MADLEEDIVAGGNLEPLLAGEGAPTALFSAQNLVTIGTVRALRRLGRHRTVALVGFDDFPLADLLDPPVTVVAQDPARMGRTAGYVSPSGAGLGILTPAEQADIGYDAVESVWKGGVPIAEFPENLQEWNDAWSRFKAA